jgi:predicted ATPase
VTRFAQHATLLAALLPAELARAVQRPNPTPQALHSATAHLAEHLAVLTSFVPAPVLDRRLAQPHEARLAPTQLSGTLLVAEVLGLQALSIQLARTGRQGGEEAGRIANRVFTALIAAIFGGDVLTAFFDSARLGSAHAALAAQSGLAVQEALNLLTPLATSVGSVGLHLRAVVHSGTLVVAEVGDEVQTEVIVSGSVVQRAMMALERSRADDVLISHEALRLLDGCETAPGPGLSDFQRLIHCPTLDLVPPTSSETETPSAVTLDALLARIVALRPYAPQNDVLHGKLDGSDAFRPATALVSDFSAFRRLLTLIEFPALVERDLSLVGQVLEAFYAPALHVVRRYGGSVHRIDLASSGNRLLALFGVPRALDDAAERAVQAALELRSRIDTANDTVMNLLRDWTARHPEQRQLLRIAGARVRQRSGIATGVMFTGVVGTAERRAFTAVGEATGAATRLMEAASEGELLLSSRVQHAVRQLVRVEPLAPLPQPGDAPALPAFRVLAALTPEEAALQRLAPLVGRRDEVAQLRAAAVQAVTVGATAGSVIAISGDPGIGKSRLVDELIDYQHELPAELILVRDACHSYEQTQPYACTRRVLRRLLALPLNADLELQAAQAEERLGELLPDELPAAPLLLELLGLPVVPNELSAALYGEQRRTRLHDLIVQLMLAYAKRNPLLLAIDNLQWCDASSRELLGQLALSLDGSPLLLLCTYRPQPALDALWANAPRATLLRLAELAPLDSATLVGNLLGGKPPATVYDLIARVQGVPFFLEATMHYLLASGALHRDAAGQWEMTQPLDDTVPLEVEQLVVARLDRLSHGVRVLAEVMAVLGAGYGALLPIVAKQPQALAAQLAELVALGLVVAGANADDGPHFKHELLRDVIYNSLSFTRRRALHARVADAIASAYAANPDAHRVVLAQHYILAEQHRRALPHLLTAARAAQARYAHQEALSLYEQAFVILAFGERDIARDHAIAADIHEAMGDILALTGNYEPARIAYQLLLASLATHGSSVRRAAIERRMGSTYEHQGSYEQALHWLDQAEATVTAVARGDGDIVERARILSDKGWVYFRRGDLTEAEDLLGMALALLDLHPDYEEQARVLNRIAGVAWQRGDIGLAQSYVERGLKVSQKSGDLVGQAKALNNLGILLESQGRVDEALRASLHAIAINEQIGNKRELALVANNLGWMLYNDGRYAQSEQRLLQATTNAAKIRDNYHYMRAALNLGRLLTEQERLEEAVHILTICQSIALQLGLTAEQLDIYVSLAEVALKQGDIERAIQLYQQAYALINDVETEEYGRLQRLEAKIALQKGEWQRAIQLLNNNIQLFLQIQYLPEAIRTRQLLNHVLSTQLYQKHRSL